MKCLALASGKGGRERPFLTASFGLALARQGASVLLLDGDMGLRNLDLPLGMEKQTRYTSWDLARGRCFEEDSILSVAPHLDFCRQQKRKTGKLFPGRHYLRCWRIWRTGMTIF